MFVSASINMMKFGKTWEIKLVVPEWPPFREKVYQAIRGLWQGLLSAHVERFISLPYVGYWFYFMGWLAFKDFKWFFKQVEQRYHRLAIYIFYLFNSISIHERASFQIFIGFRANFNNSWRQKYLFMIAIVFKIYN